MTVVASKFERKANELYETETWATEALLRNLPPLDGRRVWEPAAGNHKIVDVLTRAGASVLTSDIETYDREHDGIFDFLSDGNPYFPAGCDDIITNPPYGKQNRLAVRFAERALERCSGWVALLLTAKFDSGKTRTHLFRDNPRFFFARSYSLTASSGSPAMARVRKTTRGSCGGRTDPIGLLQVSSACCSMKRRRPPDGLTPQREKGAPGGVQARRW